ncbi:putative ribonuclease H-like domain-containing protein [Tanacetum coccineum]
MAEYSQKWHNGTSSRTRSTKTYDGLAAFQAQLKNEGLRASVCVMPFSTYSNLGLGILSHTRLTIELADRTIKQPRGIAKNVLERIGKFIFPIDFIILDIPEDDDVPLILERPFLSTDHSKIDVVKRKITLRVGEEKLVFKSIKPATSIIKRVFMIKNLDLKTELIGEGDESFNSTYGTIRRILGFGIRRIDPCTVDLAETMIIPDDQDNGMDYFEFIYWLASKFDKYWEIDKNTKNGLWEFYVNERTKGTIDDLDEYKEPCKKTCSDTFYSPFIDAQEVKYVYEVINRGYSPIPIPTHFDINNFDELCKIEEFPVVRHSIRNDEEFVTIGPSNINTVKRTPGSMSCIYHELLNKKDRGWEEHLKKIYFNGMDDVKRFGGSHQDKLCPNAGNDNCGTKPEIETLSIDDLYNILRDTLTRSSLVLLVPVSTCTSFYFSSNIQKEKSPAGFANKKWPREAELKKQRVFNTGNGVAKPVWTNANRVNHAGRPNINSVRPNINTDSDSQYLPGPQTALVLKDPSAVSTTQEHGKDRGILDSGCPMAHDSYITGKGRIKVGNLEFDSVSFVKELGHFNLFSISQICDKQHKVLFTETECLVVTSDFKMPDENQILLKVPRQHNMYSFDMKTPGPAKSFACLIAKATSDESKLWHRRLGHINFNNLNKLVKGNLVRGLPSKVFKNDHTCVACQKGKQHRASCKAKLERMITEPLHTLHMDLFRPTSVKSINHASYCLVITDDCTRFSWVFFLATKDETSGILQNFIRQIENQLNHRVKIIRSDNGTKFKNINMLEFCGNKGIKQEYSNARTPQQNGVAERMNMTLR